LVKLARQKPRYGYRRLHALLSRRGYEVNVKRVYRLYVEERLMVRRRRRKRLVRERTAEPRLTGANQEWAWWMRTRGSVWRWRPTPVSAVVV
jgi:putative transposase